MKKHKKERKNKKRTKKQKKHIIQFTIVCTSDPGNQQGSAA